MIFSTASAKAAGEGGCVFRAQDPPLQISVSTEGGLQCSGGVGMVSGTPRGKMLTAVSDFPKGRGPVVGLHCVMTAALAPCC